MKNEERDVDYLICRECNTPCYIFEMEAGKITEALCAVCGNEDVFRFIVGEIDEEET